MQYAFWQYTKGKFQHTVIAFFIFNYARASRIRVWLSLGIYISALSDADIGYARLANYRNASSKRRRPVSLPMGRGR